MRLLETSGDWVAAEERKASLAREGAFMSEVSRARLVYTVVFLIISFADQEWRGTYYYFAAHRARRVNSADTFSPRRVLVYTAAAPAPAELDEESMLGEAGTNSSIRILHSSVASTGYQQENGAGAGSTP